MGVRESSIYKVFILFKERNIRIIFDKIWSKSNVRNYKRIDYTDLAISTEEFLENLGMKYYNVRASDSFKKGQSQAIARGLGMGGGGNVDLLASLTSSLKGGAVIVETGVSMGWSSKIILEYLEDGVLISTDLPYPGKDNEIGFLVDKSHYKNWILLLGLDSVLIPSLREQIAKAGLIHYDSDKNYKGKLRSLTELYNNMAPGSWLVVDDITDNSSFRDFCTRCDIHPDIVWFNNLRDENKKQYVGIVKK